MFTAFCALGAAVIWAVAWVCKEPSPCCNCRDCVHERRDDEEDGY
jgi:hypothetical protein